jgi:hypothetical protein
MVIPWLGHQNQMPDSQRNPKHKPEQTKKTNSELLIKPLPPQPGEHHLQHDRRYSRNPLHCNGHGGPPVFRWRGHSVPSADTGITNPQPASQSATRDNRLPAPVPLDQPDGGQSNSGSPNANPPKSRQPDKTATPPHEPSNWLAEILLDSPPIRLPNFAFCYIYLRCFVASLQPAPNVVKVVARTI